MRFVVTCHVAQRKKRRVWSRMPGLPPLCFDDYVLELLVEQSGFTHYLRVRRYQNSARDSQLETDLPLEMDCLTNGANNGLCFSLYSRGENEKTRLNALVNEACDS